MGIGAHAISSLSKEQAPELFFTTNLPSKATQLIGSSISPSLNDILARPVLEGPIMDFFKKVPMPKPLVESFLLAISEVKDRKKNLYEEKKRAIYLDLLKKEQYRDMTEEQLKSEIQHIFEEKHMSSIPYHTFIDHYGKTTLYESRVTDAATHIHLGYNIDADTIKKMIRSVGQIKNTPKEDALVKHYRIWLYQKCMSNNEGFMKNLQRYAPEAHAFLLKKATDRYKEEVDAMLAAVDERNLQKQTHTPQA